MPFSILQSRQVRHETAIASGKGFIAVLAAMALGVAACGCAGTRETKRGHASGASSSGSATSKSGANVAWWLRYRPLSVKVTSRLIKEPYLSVGEIREDGRIFASYYGYLANPSDAHDVTAVVRHYYSLAAVGDARDACSMIDPRVAKTFASSFGESGPRYLKGVTTCRATASLIFAHQHRELSVPIDVTGVLTRRDLAYAIVDSRKMPASIFSLRRSSRRWWVDSLLAAPIPVAK